MSQIPVFISNHEKNHRKGAICHPKVNKSESYNSGFIHNSGLYHSIGVKMIAFNAQLLEDSYSNELLNVKEIIMNLFFKAI